MNDKQIKHMVDRFLGWRLPENFAPDCGISFEPEFNKEWMARQGKSPSLHEPTGTNLFDATQAKAMVEYMIEGLPATSPTPQPESEVMPDNPSTGTADRHDTTQPRSVSRAGLVERLDYARRRLDPVLYTDLIALLSDAAAALEAPTYTDAQIERAARAHLGEFALWVLRRNKGNADDKQWEVGRWAPDGSDKFTEIHQFPHSGEADTAFRSMRANAAMRSALAALLAEGGEG